MRKRNLLLATVLLFSFARLWAQQEVITFTGKDVNSGKYVQLTRVDVTNLTQSWTESLYFPDTTLILTAGTGIEDFSQSSFGLAQNLPNPFEGNTYATLQTAKAGKGSIVLSDITGRIVETLSISSLQPGIHHFQIQVAAAGTYILTAHQNGQTASIKMLATGSTGSNSIHHTGYSDISPKAINMCKGKFDRPFAYGDTLIYRGYASANGEEVASAIVYREETATETITLPFTVSEDFICGTSKAVDIDGNIYATVKIGEQCWMAENLRTTRYMDGKTIPLSTEMSMSIPYRYTPKGGADNIATYGYFYNWSAVMNGVPASSANPSGIQGPCPEGWHVSSETEWHQMSDFVSADETYRCNIEDSASIAKAICSTISWEASTLSCAPGNHPEDNNSTGLGLLAGGCFYNGAGFMGANGYYWTCSSGSTRAASYIFMSFGLSYMQYSGAMKDGGYAVRCVKH